MNDYLTIENGAVTKCDPNVTNVVIPDGVTVIRKYAFRYCENLESITIPNSVTFIGDRAFAYCESLESVTIPNSVTFISNEAFYRCANVIMHCNRNSYAEEYAKKNNVYYKITD
jgi:hypothetical protein